LNLANFSQVGSLAIALNAANPSIERTPNRLRRLVAAHVER
jgi:hypothetical protein